MQDLAKGFLLRLAAEGRTSATIGWYSARLSRFLTLYGGTPASRLGAENVRSFLVVVKQGTNGAVSDGYTESHRKALAALFTWAMREQLIDKSPCEFVRPYRVDIHEPATLTLPQIRVLIDAQPRGTFEGERNRTIIALLYDTGIRVGELVRIELADLDLAGGTLRVHGKARRDRRVPLSSTLRSVLWAYVQQYRPRDLSARLFTAANGAPLHETAINQWLRRTARRVGLTEVRVSPHTFRHSFATAYLQNGGDEFSLQKILGHSTLDMVRRYVHLAAGDVAARHAIASPLERMVKGGERSA